MLLTKVFLSPGDKRLFIRFGFHKSLNCIHQEFSFWDFVIETHLPSILKWYLRFIYEYKYMLTHNLLYIYLFLLLLQMLYVVGTYSHSSVSELVKINRSLLKEEPLERNWTCIYFSLSKMTPAAEIFPAKEYPSFLMRSPSWKKIDRQWDR